MKRWDWVLIMTGYSNLQRNVLGSMKSPLLHQSIKINIYQKYFDFLKPVGGLTRIKDSIFFHRSFSMPRTISSAVNVTSLIHTWGFENHSIFFLPKNWFHTYIAYFSFLNWVFVFLYFVCKVFVYSKIEKSQKSTKPLF